MKSERHLEASHGGERLNLFNDVGRADWFVRSNNPMVLMTMPGCFRKITNEAHREWMPLDKDYAKTETDFFARLNQIDAESHPGDICYCEEGPLLIALERNDCSFERCYDQLKGKPFGAVATSLTFRLVNQADFREYEISRLLALRDDSKAGLSFLESSITPFPQLRLQLRDIRKGEEIHFSATVLLNGRERFSTGFAPVVIPKEYAAFAGLMDEALYKLSAKKSLDEFEAWLSAKSNKLFPNHSQVQSIITNLFHSGDIAGALAKIRARVFDALPAWPIARKIEEIISNDVLRIPRRKHESYDMRLPMRIK